MYVYIYMCVYICMYIYIYTLQISCVSEPGVCRWVWYECTVIMHVGGGGGGGGKGLV